MKTVFRNNVVHIHFGNDSTKSASSEKPSLLASLLGLATGFAASASVDTKCAKCHANETEKNADDDVPNESRKPLA
jgi:cytochrome c553